jgi:hypothetical protein
MTCYPLFAVICRGRNFIEIYGKFELSRGGVDLAFTCRRLVDHARFVEVHEVIPQGVSSQGNF